MWRPAPTVRRVPASLPVRARRLTSLCCVAMVALALGLNLLPVFLTTISALIGGAGGLTREALGRLSAIGFSGLVVAILATGPLADRWGAKPFVLVGNALMAIGLLAAGWAPGYATLGTAVFVIGLGAGTLDMVLSPVVAALNPERRSAAMNWLHSFYCVGGVLIALAGAVAISTGLGWRWTCTLLAPLPLALVAAFAPLRFPALAQAGERVPIGTLLADGRFRLALIAILLGGATELGMAQWLPAYTETTLGYAPWVGSVAFLAFSLAMTVGRMVIGAAGNRIDPYHSMAVGCALSVVLFLAGSFLPVPGAALACCILAGFAGAALWPTMLAVTADRWPQGGASMFGLLAAFGNAGGIVMPWLVGWIADVSDLRWGLAVSALAPLLMAPLILRLRR